MQHPVAPTSRRALISVLIAGLAWGTGGPAAAFLFQASGLDAVGISFWRLAGGACWLALSWPFLGRTPLTKQLFAAPLSLGLNGAGLAVVQLAYFASVDLVGVALSTVISLGSAPLLIALATRERITPTHLLALLGLTLLTYGAEGAATTNSLLGIALALLSGAAYATTTLLNRNTPNPATTALLSFGLGALFLFPFALSTGLLPTPASLPMIAYLGLVPTAIAYTLFYQALPAIRPTTAALLALTEPLLATFLGILLFHESLTPTAILGGLLLLASLTTRALRE